MNMIRMLLKPFQECKNIVSSIIIFWPCTQFGNSLRIWFYKRKLKSLGKNANIESGVLFGQPEKIVIGEECIFGRNVNVNAGECNGIFIGNNIALAEGTYIRSGNHRFDNLDIPILRQGHRSKVISYANSTYSVVIEDNVWVGAHSIILSGAWIGSGSVIGAGARVSGVIPQNSIVVGNPGVIVGNRKEKYGSKI